MSPVVIGRAKPAIPPDGKCLVGTHTTNTTSDWAQWVSDSQATNQQHWATFIPDNDNFNLAISQANTIASSIKALHIAWSFPGTNFLSGIAAGTDDAYILARAHELATYGRPVFARLNWEFQNSYYAYGVWDQANNFRPGNVPSYYVAAWQRIVSMVRPIAPNVAFVWCPHLWRGDHGDGTDYQITDWYPGDDYVDWCAINAYPGASNWDYMRNDGFWGLVKAHRHAVDHGKPMMVCEWGLGEQQSNTGDPVWINQFLDWVESSPAVKGICYFNLDNTFRNGVDYRLQAQTNSRAVYRARITANSRYITG